MPDSSPYVRGPTYARKELPTFEFKASSTNYTGGGYARVRSTEHRDHTTGDDADDVFVSVHRLAAVAWLLDDGVLGTDVFLADMGGCDVHHTLEFPSANVGDSPNFDERGLELLEHNRHSEITQSDMRAWAEDTRQEVFEYDETDIPEARCTRCDCALDSEYRVGGESYCLECSTMVADGESIEVVQ